MRVLSINIFYPAGSTGKIVYDLHNQLIANGEESFVCYGRGDIVSEENVYKFATNFMSQFYTYVSCLSGLQYSYSYFETLKLFEIIRKIKPDIIHLHCLNCHIVNIYSLLCFLKIHKYRTVLTLHAETMYTANCDYAYDCNKWKTGCGNCPHLWRSTHSILLDRTAESWRRMYESFEGFGKFLHLVPVSEWVQERASHSPFFKNIAMTVVRNGIDTTNVFYYRKNDNLIQLYKKNSEKIILHVTPSFRSKIKGGKYVIELAKELLDENIKIIVVGYDGGFELPSNIIPIAHTQNQIELAELYSLADVTLLTSERETFSMICAETLACGTPVVGFKAGAPERISLSAYSEFVPFGDLKSLKQVVLKWVNNEANIRDELIKESKLAYSKELMFQKYYQIYQSLRNI